MPKGTSRQERYEKLQERRETRPYSQPASRVTSPARSDRVAAATSGSNPDVSRAVEVMVAEVSMFEEIMEKINALVTEFREYKEQNDLRLQQHEEALQRPSTERQPCPAETDNPQPEPRSEQDELVQQLRQQLEERSEELARAQRQLLGYQRTLPGFPTVSPQVQGSMRDAEIHGLRQQLQQRNAELEEARRLTRASRMPDAAIPQAYNATLARDHPQPLPRSRPSTPEPVPQPRTTGNQQDPVSTLPYHAAQLHSLRSFSPRRGGLSECQPSAVSSAPTVNYVFTKETVPHFRGEVSASQPLKKNQEVEGWIRAIENIIKPTTSEAYIQAARANCRGSAELIINSPLFDNITDWNTFKAALRSKFRGTYTSADFFKVLYDIKMVPGQAPMDFFLQLEGSVYQGHRDHREAIGDPSQLVKRVFISGLPAWLHDFLALKEDGSPAQIAEAAQRIWNSRHGIQHCSTVHQPEDWIQRPSRPSRARDMYAMPVAARPMNSHSTTGHRWCEYHRLTTHNTAECRAKARRDTSTPQFSRRCYECRSSEHFVRDCPFRQRQGDEAPRSPGQGDPGSVHQGNYTSGNGRISEIPRMHGTTTRADDC